MKLWLISNAEDRGYDQFYAAVVVSSTEEEARRTHPHKDGWHGLDGWVPPERVAVKYLGEADPALPPGVLCTDFSAG